MRPHKISHASKNIAKRRTSCEQTIQNTLMHPSSLDHMHGRSTGRRELNTRNLFGVEEDTRAMECCNDFMSSSTRSSRSSRQIQHQETIIQRQEQQEVSHNKIEPPSMSVSLSINNDETRMTFPEQLMAVLSNHTVSDIVTWLPHGHGWLISNKKRFTEEVLPKAFYGGKKPKWPSFTRKLNRWRFTRVTRGDEVGAYYHPLFQRGNHMLCTHMICIGSRDPQRLEPLNPVALGLVDCGMIQQSSSIGASGLEDKQGQNQVQQPQDYFLTAAIGTSANMPMSCTTTESLVAVSRHLVPGDSTPTSSTSIPSRMALLQQQYVNATDQQPKATSENDSMLLGNFQTIPFFTAPVSATSLSGRINTTSESLQIQVRPFLPRTAISDFGSSRLDMMTLAATKPEQDKSQLIFEQRKAAYHKEDHQISPSTDHGIHGTITDLEGISPSMFDASNSEESLGRHQSESGSIWSSEEDSSTEKDTQQIAISKRVEHDHKGLQDSFHAQRTASSIDSLYANYMDAL